MDGLLPCRGEQMAFGSQSPSLAPRFSETRDKPTLLPPSEPVSAPGIKNLDRFRDE